VTASRGPLDGVRVLEVGGIGPTPFAAMLLADMGADVLRIERSAAMAARAAHDPTMRGRQTVVLDIKADAGRDAVLRAGVSTPTHRRGCTLTASCDRLHFANERLPRSS